MDCARAVECVILSFCAYMSQENAAVNASAAPKIKSDSFFFPPIETDTEIIGGTREIVFAQKCHS